MKIALIEPNKMGGGSIRAKAYKKFLTKYGNDVDIIKIPENNYKSKIWFNYQSLIGKFNNDKIKIVKKIANKLEKKIKEEHYDVVIGIETKFSYVFTSNLNCLKLFSCESLEADERYFSKQNKNIKHIKKWRKIETEIFESSDYVIFPWKTTQNYVKKYIYNGRNFVTIKYGCYPQKKTASYFFPISIVSLGNLRPYWANKDLLSYLTNISPYTIDVYGKFKPERKYHLNYKGFANSLDVLCNYQFGLNTISKDIFRCNHHSSRIMSYIAYGLPVLSPEWMKFSNELKGCLSYNKENFLDIIEEYSDIDHWEKLNKEAIEQAHELDWNITLKPLLKIINK